MQRWSWWVLVLAVVAGLAARLDAQTSEQAAALLYYPYVVVDPSRGLDTRLLLSNASASAPIEVRCFYFDSDTRCLSDGKICTNFQDCAPGDFCIPAFSETVFPLVLTRGQPLSWPLSQGLATLPCQPPSVCLGGDSNSATGIPPVPSQPFTGSMVCVATDSSGFPIDRNDLTGAVSIERYQAAPTHVDVARYNAIGLLAIPGGNDHDPTLVLGGSSPVIPSLNTRAEYQGCPSTVMLDAVADGAPDPIAADRQVFTTVALLPCGLDSRRVDYAHLVVQILVYNEFEQRFSTSHALGPLLVRRLSLLDTRGGQGSIFSFGVLGTLASQIRFRGIGDGRAPIFGRYNGGFLAVAIEEHVDPHDASNFNWAAINPQRTGLRSTPDFFVAAPEACTHPQTPLTCGDGHVCGVEECDDGNSNDGDGCSTSCQVEPCYICTGETPAGPGACSPVAAGTSCIPDLDPCTLDECNATGVCTHPPAPFGDRCTSDSNACTLDLCDGAGGCLHLPGPAGIVCEDDFNVCTVDQCDATGACLHAPGAAGTPCDDDFNICTIDQCDAAGVCLHEPGAEGTPCDDDFNVCTVDQCNATGVCTHEPGAAAAPCDDDFNACTVDQCDDAGVCLHQPAAAGTPCDDDFNLCTIDQCDDTGTCLHGPGLEGTPCDDDFDACTLDQCDAAGVCTHPPAPPVCGDGKVCGDEQCDDGNTVSGDGCEADCTLTPG